ncbi:MAG: hypothetical protein ABSA27_01695 [Terriglobales bacterium]
MGNPLQTAFDSVENAQQYVRLLVEAIAETKTDIAADLAIAEKAKSERRIQALRIVQFKLDSLERHLKTSSRLLNDLRSLRRLLLEERPLEQHPLKGHLLHEVPLNDRPEPAAAISDPHFEK